MALEKSSAATLSTTAQRTAMAASAESVAKTPDYHLPWTGPVVEQALQKAMDLDPSSVGGILVVPSTSDTPANADDIVDPGEYIANFFTASDLPAELQGVTPVKLTVSIKDGIIYQEIEGLGDKWTRFSSDNGDTWSVWSPKPTASGGIDISGDPEVPTPDPIDDITDRLDKIEKNMSGTLTSGASFGSEEMAQQMLAKTYNYDAAAAASEEAE